MNRATTIRLFLPDGGPDGLWLVEKSNWTGVALVIPRSIYKRVRSEREELGRAGVYVLTGPSETKLDAMKVYVGECDVLRKRLDHHHAAKDFWTRAVVFTTKDASLNKAHVRYLESRLIARAHETKRAEVENGNAPALPVLAEAESADIEGFLDDMLLLYPVLGVEAFEKLDQVDAQRPHLYLRGLGAEAQGRETPEGFVVLTGSRARPDEVPSIHSYLKELRQTLAAEGVLEVDSDGLRLTRDYLFNSPSTAAGVLLGRSANGRIEWKDGNGQTLKEIQSAEVDYAT